MTDLQTAIDIIEKHDIDIDEVIEYLDDLREGGTINMFSAGPYLEGEFSFNRHDARTIAGTYTMNGLREEEES